MRDRDDAELASAVGQDRPPAGERRGILGFVKLELRIFLAAVLLGVIFVVVIVVLATS